MSDMAGVRCLWMRAGTSKGAYFLNTDLPSDPAQRDALLLDLMGSPDPRQIDGIGGGDPLTSKVAVLSPSTRPDADVDYLFLQVFVDQPRVSSEQNCGNILAGVAPAAIERGLVKATDPVTQVRIHMVNSREIAVADVQTPGGQVSYVGGAAIDGVPGTHAPVRLVFQDTAGSTCGALLPTGREVDRIDGIDCTLIDNGMPVVAMRAADFGLTGQETRAELEADTKLAERIEAIRLIAGPMMGLGDVTTSTVPKMTLVSPALNGGTINTRSWIPHRVHASVGIFAAISVATACLLKSSPAHGLASPPSDGTCLIEHPTGAIEVLLDIAEDGTVKRAGTVRTARKLFDGRVFP